MAELLNRPAFQRTELAPVLTSIVPEVLTLAEARPLVGTDTPVGLVEIMNELVKSNEVSEDPEFDCSGFFEGLIGTFQIRVSEALDDWWSAHEADSRRSMRDNRLTHPAKGYGYTFFSYGIKTLGKA